MHDRDAPDPVPPTSTVPPMTDEEADTDADNEAAGIEQDLDTVADALDALDADDLDAAEAGVAKLLVDDAASSPPDPG